MDAYRRAIDIDQLDAWSMNNLGLLLVETKRAELGDAVNEGRLAAEQARADMVTDFDANAAGAQPEGAAS